MTPIDILIALFVAIIYCKCLIVVIRGSEKSDAIDYFLALICVAALSLMVLGRLISWLVSLPIMNLPLW